METVIQFHPIFWPSFLFLLPPLAAGVVEGDMAAVEAYKSSGGDIARQLTADEVQLLNRSSAFGVGYTLVHLAIRFQRQDMLAILLTEVSPLMDEFSRVTPKWNRSRTSLYRRTLVCTWICRAAEPEMTSDFKLYCTKSAKHSGWDYTREAQACWCHFDAILCFFWSATSPYNCSGPEWTICSRCLSCW